MSQFTKPYRYSPIIFLNWTRSTLGAQRVASAVDSSGLASRKVLFRTCWNPLGCVRLCCLKVAAVMHHEDPDVLRLFLSQHELLSRVSMPPADQHYVMLGSVLSGCTHMHWYWPFCQAIWSWTTGWRDQNWQDLLVMSERASKGPARTLVPLLEPRHVQPGA